MENSKELFSERITSGNRTYFFDIKKAENGSLYLLLSESKRTDDAFKRHRVIIFEEDIKRFKRTFKKATKELKKLTSFENRTISSRIDEIRKKHPRAYISWSTEEDEKLEKLFCEGKTVKELTTIFERNEGAIRSRIRKLELVEKY